MLMKFLNYSFIGLINTFIGYFIIFYLTYLNLLPEIANLLGYLTGFVLSYILNKKYNFKSKENYKKDLTKFFFSMSIAYMINLLVLIILFRFLEINIYLSQIISGIVYLCSGFILSYFYTFNSKK